jgi:hypothetical protein
MALELATAERRTAAVPPVDPLASRIWRAVVGTSTIMQGIGAQRIGKGIDQQNAKRHQTEGREF